MKYIMSILVLATLLVGCDRVEGQFNVTSDLKLKNSSGDSHLIKIGTYTADLRQSTFGKRIVLRLNNDQNEKFEFRIPDGAKIPSNGAFAFKSSDIGQAVDLNGTVNTKVTDSQVRQEFLSCTYQEPYTVCNPGPNGQPICSTYMRTVYGSQWVRYYDRFVEQNFAMNVSPANAQQASAEFTGNANYSQRIVVDQTPCH